MSITLVFLMVVQALLRSVEGLAAPGSALGRADALLEQLAMGFFTFEFLLRLYAAPADPSYWSRRRYLLSAYGLIDVLTVGPFFLGRCRGSPSPLLRDLAKIADDHDEELRLLRILRLGALDHYVPSVRFVRQVFRNPAIRRQLAVASYVGATIWLIASCLLSLTERWNPEEPEQRERFGTVLSAMPFTLVHLTGDYPLIDYTLPAKVVHFAMLVLMSGFVAVPAGIVAAGFKQEMQEARQLARLERKASVERAGAAPAVARGAPRATPWEAWAQGVVAARLTRQLRNAASVTSVAAELALSCPRLSGSPFLRGVEVAATVGFTADYALRLLAAPADPELASRAAFAASFEGVVDAVSVVPFWVEGVLLAAGAQGAHLNIFALVRVLRLLQLETGTRAIRLFSHVFHSCSGTIAASGILALLIWLFSAVLFYEFERGNPRLDGAFDSIPESMYYTAVFLADEWAAVDFTPAGKLLMVVLCAVAIAIAAIPIGSLFEAFEDALREGGGKKDD